MDMVYYAVTVLNVCGGCMPFWQLENAGIFHFIKGKAGRMNANIAGGLVC